MTLLDAEARSVGGSHFSCYVLLFIIKAVAVHVVLLEQQRLIVGKLVKYNNVQFSLDCSMQDICSIVCLWCKFVPLSDIQNSQSHYLIHISVVST